ncbi:MAG TPA: hypothetical protein VLJ38_02315 [Polyangiaceae bacterium]|nr:hypothetical protein [Polyangiaceae bacterium]
MVATCEAPSALGEPYRSCYATGVRGDGNACLSAHDDCIQACENPSASAGAGGEGGRGDAGASSTAGGASGHPDGGGAPATGGSGAGAEAGGSPDTGGAAG